MKYLLILVLAITLTVEANPIIGSGILSNLPLANGGLLGLGGNRNTLGGLEKIPQKLGALAKKIPEAILGLGPNHGLDNHNPISGIGSGIQKGKKHLDDLNLKF